MNYEEWELKIDTEIAEGKRCGRINGSITCCNWKPCEEHDLGKPQPELRAAPTKGKEQER